MHRRGKGGHEGDWTDGFLSLTAIKRISATGVETEQGDYAFDMIVFATGFDAMTGPLKSMGVVGANGATITDAWEAGPRTYLGLQVADLLCSMSGLYFNYKFIDYFIQSYIYIYI